jgi:hypothetical protein
MLDGKQQPNLHTSIGLSPLISYTVLAYMKSIQLLDSDQETTDAVSTTTVV